MGATWPRYLAIAFGVVTLGAGAGFLVGGVSFMLIGRDGHLFNSPFGHIAEVMGWGAGFLVSSLATFRLLGIWGRSASVDRAKPATPTSHGLD